MRNVYVTNYHAKLMNVISSLYPVCLNFDDLGYKFHVASSNLDLDLSISSSKREMEEELRIDDELEADILNPIEE